MAAYPVRKRDGGLFQLAFGGQLGRRDTKYFEDNKSFIQKLKINCLFLYYFWS